MLVGRQDTDTPRVLPRGPDGRELPPVAPGSVPPPAQVPAWQYAEMNLQSSYAPPAAAGGARYPSDARERMQGEDKPEKAAAPAFTQSYDIEAKV